MDMMKWYGKVSKDRCYGKPPGRTARRPLHVRTEGGHITYEMRVDDVAGDFIAVVPDSSGDYYTSKSRADLVAFMEALAADSVVLNWRRCIVVKYSATGVDDGHSYDLGDALPTEDEHEELTARERRKKKHKRRLAALEMVRHISLTFEICDYSAEPVERGAENAWTPKGYFYRVRDVLGDPEDPNRTGSPSWAGDSLPAGAMSYTPERVRVLEDVQRALGKLDARMREFLGGDPDELAARIDAMTDTARLLGTGS